MDTVDMTGLLGFGTLIVGLLIAVIIWEKFMRDPKNRHPMAGERERNIHEIREDVGDQPMNKKALRKDL